MPKYKLITYIVDNIKLHYVNKRDDLKLVIEITSFDKVEETVIFKKREELLDLNLLALSCLGNC